MARRFFSGNTVEQALLSAARAFTAEPEQIAYTLRDKKHGFLKVRRRVVIEVDPEAPLKNDAGEIAEAESQETREISAPEQPSETEAQVSPDREEPSREEEPEEEWSAKGEEAPDERSDSPEPAPAARAPRARGGRGRAPQKKRKAEETPPPETSRELVSPEDAADLALDELTHFLCVDVSWDIQTVEDGFEIEIEGPDQEWLLDDDGSLLLAIEHLLPRMVRSLSGQSRSCSVDCDNFHSSHEAHLRELAERAAEKAIRSGRPQTLEPMTPADRRVVHLHLVNDPTVGTQSKGDGLYKRVRIFPARPA